MDPKIKLLIERIEATVKDPENSFPPLIIFPEGTVGANQGLFRFKRGAFMTFQPVKIYGIRYL